jgi:hypothetical protein
LFLEVKQDIFAVKPMQTAVALVDEPVALSVLCSPKKKTANFQHNVSGSFAEPSDFGGGAGGAVDVDVAPVTAAVPPVPHKMPWE